MKVKGTRTIALSDLTANLFVRRELDTEHAMYLGQLIEAGVEMKDLIEVTDFKGHLEIVDGRHRKEGYELAGVKEVKVKVLEFDSESEMIAYAYRCNTGGSKPPTPADTEHTVTLLLERGESMKAIGEMLALPTSMARKYANQVKSKLNHAKLQRAVAAITEGGLTVSKAAEQYEVEPERLKEILSGHTKKHRKGITETHRMITQVHKTWSLKNANLLKRLIEKYEDADVTEKQVRDIFKHLEDLQRKSSRSVSEWKKRFEGMNGKMKEASAA